MISTPQLQPSLTTQEHHDPGRRCARRCPAIREHCSSHARPTARQMSCHRSKTRPCSDKLQSHQTSTAFPRHASFHPQGELEITTPSPDPTNSSASCLVTTGPPVQGLELSNVSSPVGPLENSIPRVGKSSALNSDWVVALSNSHMFVISVLLALSDSFPLPILYSIVMVPWNLCKNCVSSGLSSWSTVFGADLWMLLLSRVPDIPKTS